MFALGDYHGAAAVLNNLLAVAPGMDWTTLSGLYGDVEAYTAQLRALEAYCQQKPDDAAARFVLAYHYLVAGHDDAAVEQLKARRCPAARRPGGRPHAGGADAAGRSDGRTCSARAPAGQPAGPPPAQAGPTTDLVGSWRAERNGDVFELSIDENSQFTWKAVPKGKPPVTLAGTMATAGQRDPSGEQGPGHDGRPGHVGRGGPVPVHRRRQSAGRQRAVVPTSRAGRLRRRRMLAMIGDWGRTKGDILFFLLLK